MAEAKGARFPGPPGRAQRTHQGRMSDEDIARAWKAFHDLALILKPDAEAGRQVGLLLMDAIAGIIPVRSLETANRFRRMIE